MPALAVLWGFARLTCRESAPALVRTWPWDLLVSVTTGAAIYGLMADTPVTSPVFPSRLFDAVGDLFRPMNMETHPFYSLRVGLTFIEGWVVFRLVSGICRLAPDPAARARLTLAGWMVGMALVAVGALLQYVTEFNLHPYWVKANPALVRTNSTLDDPNALGALLALSIGLVIGYLRLGERTQRNGAIALAALLGLGLVTTMSRAAIGAVVLAPIGVLAIGPAPTSVWQRRVRTVSRTVMALFVLAVAGSMVLRAFTTEQRRTNPSGPIDMVVKTFDPRESTGWVLRGRLPWWQAGVSMYREYPGLGAGLGRYPRLMAGHGGGRIHENTHNLYLQLAAEAGTVGLSALVLFSVAFVTTLAIRVKRVVDPASRTVALGATIGTVAFLLTMLTGHTLLVPSGQIVFAAFLALTLTITADSRKAAGSLPHRVAGIAGLFVIAFVAPAVGLTRGVAPPSGVWGHNLGLHQEERPESAPPYRWTADRAVLDLAVPDGATTLIVKVMAVNPVRSGEPTRAAIKAGATTRELTFTSDELQAIRFPLTPGSRRVTVNVSVAPTFVPGGGDPRQLGIQLLRPAFE